MMTSGDAGTFSLPMPFPPVTGSLVDFL